jgi:hypothetical protein
MPVLFALVNGDQEIEASDLSSYGRGAPGVRDGRWELLSTAHYYCTDHVRS